MELGMAVCFLIDRGNEVLADADKQVPRSFAPVKTERRRFISRMQRRPINLHSRLTAMLVACASCTLKQPATLEVCVLFPTVSCYVIMLSGRAVYITQLLVLHNYSRFTAVAATFARSRLNRKSLA